MRPSIPTSAPCAPLLNSPSVPCPRLIFAPYDILHSLAGRHAEGFDRLNLLLIDVEGIVSVLHSLFCVSGGD